MTKLVVIDTEEEGRVFTQFQNINEEHLEFLHKYFMDFGIEPPDIEDLEEALERLNDADITVKMSVTKNSGGYINGRVVSVVEGEITEPETETETDSDDKQILIDLCEKYEIKIPAKIQKKEQDDIVSFINDSYEVDAEKIENENDVIVLQSYGIEIANTNLKKADKKAKGKKKEKASGDTDILKKVCTDFGVDFEEDDTDEQLGERLSDGYKWSQKEDGLTDEQVEAMKNVGVKVTK